jgi:hypothetical protein
MTDRVDAADRRGAHMRPNFRVVARIHRGSVIEHGVLRATLVVDLGDQS